MRKKKQKSRKSLIQKMPLTYSGRWLRFVRKTILGLTQAQLADKFEVTRGTVWNWEHDRNEGGLPVMVIESIKALALDAMKRKEELHQQVINPEARK